MQVILFPFVFRCLERLALRLSTFVVSLIDGDVIVNENIDAIPALMDETDAIQQALAPDFPPVLVEEPDAPQQEINLPARVEPRAILQEPENLNIPGPRPPVLGRIHDMELMRNPRSGLNASRRLRPGREHNNVQHNPIPPNQPTLDDPISPQPQEVTQAARAQATLQHSEPNYLSLTG